MNSNSTTPTLDSSSQCGFSDETHNASASSTSLEKAYMSRRERRQTRMPEIPADPEEKEKAQLLAEPWVEASARSKTHSIYAYPLPTLTGDNGPGQGEWRIPSASSLCAQIGHDVQPRTVQRVLGSVLSAGMWTPSATQCRRCAATIDRAERPRLFRKKDEGLGSCTRLVLQ